MFGKRLINTQQEGPCTTDTLQILGDTSCVATYRLNGDATDLSGNYNGTATNVTYVTGQFGDAGSFNGSSSKIVVPSGFPLGSSERSVSCWVKSTNTTSNQTLLQYGVGGTPYYFFVFRLNGLNNSSLEFSDWNSEYSVSASSIFDGEFHHCVLTYNGSLMQFYLDGNTLGGTNSTSLNTQAGSVGIGAYNTGTVSLNGQLDQVRIFNKAITSTEVRTLYNEVAC